MAAGWRRSMSSLRFRGGATRGPIASRSSLAELSSPSVGHCSNSRHRLLPTPVDHGCEHPSPLILPAHRPTSSVRGEEEEDGRGEIYFRGVYKECTAGINVADSFANNTLLHVGLFYVKRWLSW
jgi:hypothetical protein